jgi:hypothetical protein
VLSYKEYDNAQAVEIVLKGRVSTDAIVANPDTHHLWSSLVATCHVRSSISPLAKKMQPATGSSGQKVRLTSYPFDAADIEKPLQGRC